jgi:hypothetical protein
VRRFWREGIVLYAANIGAKGAKMFKNDVLYSVCHGLTLPEEG